jgi:dTDP-4-amino-4,6-dideoxygalactose transaminase
MGTKHVIDDLAVFGGTPAFSNTLHVGRPNVGDRERLLGRIGDLLDRVWLTNNGPLVQEFERAICDMTGARHCVAMCNATIGLELAIRALGMRGEVIVPSFTFIATAHALQWQEIKPIFCDIDPRTHNIDPRQVEALITPNTTGIIGVHVWGRPCDVSALEDIARRRGLKLLYDAAHAFGCSLGGRMIGNFGDAEVFSFHATKFFNTFEGGAVVTNDGALAQRLRLMKNFGFAGYDSVVYIGTNGKMSEVAAAMGLTSMENMQSFITTNDENYRRYREGLADVPGITLLAFDPAEKNNLQYVVIEVDAERTKISRDLLLELLQAENALVRRYFWPGCHNMEPYRSYQPHARLLLPHTEAVASRVLVLPTGTGVRADQIQTLCSIIRYAVSNGSEITRRLESARANSTNRELANAPTPDNPVRTA